MIRSALGHLALAQYDIDLNFDGGATPPGGNGDGGLLLRRRRRLHRR